MTFDVRSLFREGRVVLLGGSLLFRFDFGVFRIARVLFFVFLAGFFFSSPSFSSPFKPAASLFRFFSAAGARLGGCIPVFSSLIYALIIFSRPIATSSGKWFFSAISCAAS